MRRLFNLIRDAWDFFRPLKREDFGEYGVLVRNEAGDLVPMDEAYFDNLKAETHEAMENHWLELEAEALETHGPGIMQVH